MKSILVTGGAGFVGSHTCVCLLDCGYIIYNLDSFINSFPKALDRIRKISFPKRINSGKLFNYEGDIRNISLIQKIFYEARIAGNPIQAVIHFAALKSVSKSMIDSAEYWDVNVEGTKNIIKVMQENDCKTFVFSSSAMVYGESNGTNLKENLNCNPSNNYGKTKLEAEKFLRNIFNKYPGDWKIANLRYFNPIGAHDSGLIGDSPREISNNIFPIILKVGLGQIDHIKIFGSDWPTYDGTPIRDFVHVMDIAEGHIKVLEFLELEEAQFLCLNLGTGKGTSVLDLIKVFQEENQIEIPYVFSSKRKGDVANLVADNYLAEEILDWRPKRNIREMCCDGWRWKILNPYGLLEN